MLQGLGAAVTTAEIVGFQRKGSEVPMHPHGHPDPVTLISMGVYDPTTEWSNAQRSYIERGSKPQSFGRDLQGVSNQIPQWAWLATGVLFVGLGIFAYKKASKKKK